MANPGVWMVLIAIALLLAGACVWGVPGYLDITVTAAPHSSASICMTTETFATPLVTGCGMGLVFCCGSQ